MLAAVLDPLHRPAERARQERDQQILGIDVALDAETAADVERDAAHAGFRQRSTAAASRRTQCTTWVADQIVTASVRGSCWPTTPRHSIGMAA